MPKKAVIYSKYDGWVGFEDGSERLVHFGDELDPQDPKTRELVTKLGVEHFSKEDPNA